MAENKKSFVLYADYIESIEELSDEEAGRLLKHIFRYVNDKNPVCEDKAVKLTFIPIKQQLKRDLLNWESTKEKRSIAGKASVAAKKVKKENQHNLTKSTSVENVETDLTKSTVTEDVTVTVTVDDILLEKETKENSRFKPPSLLQVQDYIIEKKYLTVSAQSFWNFYESKNWYVGKNKMKDWKKAIAGWESREKEKYGKANQSGNTSGLQTNR